LQAAWCEALAQGRKAKLTDFTTGIVAINEATRCTPDAKRKATYRRLQDQHESLSQAMRPLFG
jgi:hypothetical protein